MLLAAFKLVAGQCAIRVVAPLSAALLVLVTFALGRKAVSDQVGAAAAWLIATSPAVIYTMMSPMSDLPAAVFWALAAYGCLNGSKQGALLAGAAAAAAILVRPNLVHVAVVLALWLALRDFRLPARRPRFARILLFSTPVGLACLAVAAINQHLYGSPLSSGYGDPATLFSMDRVGRNIFNYGWWIVQSQTPIALVGLIALWTPALSLLGLMSLAVVASYLLYLVFDSWWYLRFLLPCWPAMCLGTARLLARPSGDSFSRTGKLVLFALGLYGLWYAYGAQAFEFGRHERRYAAVARLVRNMTEPNSVVITTQHSGSVRYYGERMTLRYEVLNAPWLDRTVAWLRDQGIHPYILLDSWEHDAFKQKFARRNELGRLNIATVFEYRGSTSTFLYDPLKPADDANKPIVVTAETDRAQAACPPPRNLPDVFPLR
jgi:hypothetical protein